MEKFSGSCIGLGGEGMAHKRGESRVKRGGDDVLFDSKVTFPDNCKKQHYKHINLKETKL